jgi:protein TonB
MQPAISQEQQGGSFYLFKSNWQPAKDIGKAAYFMEVIKQNDTTYMCRFYNKYGPMIRQEAYLDSNLSIPNGRFCWYDSNGYLDSTGIVSRKNKDGVWNYYNDSLKTIRSLVYNKGHFIETRVYKVDTVAEEEAKHIVPNSTFKEAELNDAVFTAIDADTTWKKYLETNIHAPERFLKVFKPGVHPVTFSFTVNKQGSTEDIYLLRSCEWSADTAVLYAVQRSPVWDISVQNGAKIYAQQQSVTFMSYYSSDDSSVKSKWGIYIGLLSEPKFPDAETGWSRFLERNLRPYVTAEHNAPDGNYTVIVSFVINEEGYMSDVYALNDPGYGTAEEAIRVLKKSPRWVPAMIDNKPVQYRTTQAVTFSISGAKVDYYNPLQ